MFLSSDRFSKPQDFARSLRLAFVLQLQFSLNTILRNCHVFFFFFWQWRWSQSYWNFPPLAHLSRPPAELPASLLIFPMDMFFIWPCNSVLLSAARHTKPTLQLLGSKATFVLHERVRDLLRISAPKAVSKYQRPKSVLQVMNDCQVLRPTCWSTPWWGLSGLGSPYSFTLAFAGLRRLWQWLISLFPRHLDGPMWIKVGAHAVKHLGKWRHGLISSRAWVRKEEGGEGGALLCFLPLRLHAGCPGARGAACLPESTSWESPPRTAPLEVAPVQKLTWTPLSRGSFIYFIFFNIYILSPTQVIFFLNIARNENKLHFNFNWCDMGIFHFGPFNAQQCFF